MVWSGLVRWFRKEDPRVFLGVLAVMPRTDIRRHFDADPEDERTLQPGLRRIFTLAPASEVDDPLPTDLVLDVYVSKFRGGQFGLGIQGLPAYIDLLFFWRPMVSVSARLRYLTTGRTKDTFHATARMPARTYLARPYEFRSWSDTRPSYRPDDLDCLLETASLKLLGKVNRSIYPHSGNAIAAQAPTEG